MPDEPQRQKMKFDLPEVYTRAIRVRAGLDGVNPRDVVTAALDVYLADELALVRKRLAGGDTEIGGTGRQKGRRKE